MPLHIPPEARDAAPGVIGALIAIPWTRGPLIMRASMFVGGSALSFFGSDPFVQYMQMSADGKGLSGFMLGLFGMSLVAKVYEAISAFAAGELAQELLAWARRRLGASSTKQEGDQ